MCSLFLSPHMGILCCYIFYSSTRIPLLLKEKMSVLLFIVMLLSLRCELLHSSTLDESRSTISINFPP